jgi:hypothetical protein
VRRRLFNLAAVTSATLCLATIVFWVRSYWRVDNLNYRHFAADSRPFDEMFCSAKGIIIVAHDTTDESQLPSEVKRTRGLRWSSYAVSKDVDPLHEVRTDGWYFLGFGYGWRELAPGPWLWSRSSVLFPYAAFVLASAVLPARWLSRLRRRARPGRCVPCGYDLRATPRAPQEGGALVDRCPECGAVATVPPLRTLPPKAM